MKLYLYDKTEYEMDIITDILEEENISYKTKRHAKEYIDCPFGKTFIILFDIEVDVESYENLEFIKYLANKRITNRQHIENCYDLISEEPIKEEINSWAKSIIDSLIIKKG